MRIWRDGKGQTMHGFSLVGELLKPIVNGPSPSAAKRPDDLTPEERLYVVVGSEKDWTPRQIARLHLDCFCFDEAYEGFLEMRHHRKLGDVAWALGNLDLAERHYSDVSHGYQSYRNGPDGDRLVRLAFVRDDPDAFLRAYDNLGIAPETRERAWVNGVGASTSPYLEMLAVISRRRPEAFDEEFLEGMEEIFLITSDEWSAFAADARYDDPAFIDDLRARCLPMPCRHEKIDRESALAKGATERAERLLRAILDSDRIVDEAQDALERYSVSGDEAELDLWCDRVFRFETDDLTGNILFRTLGHNSYEAGPELIEKLKNHRPEMRSLIARNTKWGEDARKVL